MSRPKTLVEVAQELAREIETDDRLLAIGFAMVYRSWRYGLDAAPWSEPVGFIGLAAAAFGAAVASRYWGFG